MRPKPVEFISLDKVALAMLPGGTVSPYMEALLKLILDQLDSCPHYSAPGEKKNTEKNRGYMVKMLLQDQVIKNKNGLNEFLN